MSSTYSPDLRIELIGTGDQAGVWGATTNNNLAYVLEQAIAGYVSVSVISANQALTYLNGASTVAADNQSVHSALALTTTTGANFAVYAPPASKQYTIYNASSYTATIYNSTVIGNTTAAGTGVAIPTGKTMTVWSDGTNFTQQNTHLISPTVAGGTFTSPALVTPALGTPASGTMTNVTGLPISTGVSGLGTGVATFLATPSSANLAAAVTNETGSGALVFATSPTLVTPALGTPASGVMTNATGLPLTTGVTGTLPVANGGTGVTTSTGSGNNVLSTSPTLVTPILGTPTSGNLSNCTNVSLTAGVSGTLPVANGGTGVTTSTGSGNNVLSTSPTLVTPILGTPASGTLTNATGLPLTTGVIGTLPVANGGTGNTTAQAEMNRVAAAVTSGQYLRGNGTNVVMSAIQAGDVPTLNQNTTGTAAGLSATLAVASGGTGVTVSTGSGSNVLNNSPSLITPFLGTPAAGVLSNCSGLPLAGVSGFGVGVRDALALPVGSAGAPVLFNGALGTPSSGTLTSATGLPLTTGVTGTLPVANGGTGATSITSGALVKGNGSSAFSAASAADIVGQIGSTAVTNSTNSTRITNSGGWSVTPSGTKLYFNYNGTNVASLDSSGNFIALADVTAFGTP